MKFLCIFCVCILSTQSAIARPQTVYCEHDDWVGTRTDIYSPNFLPKHDDDGLKLPDITYIFADDGKTAVVIAKGMTMPAIILEDDYISRTLAYSYDGTAGLDMVSDDGRVTQTYMRHGILKGETAYVFTKKCVAR